MIKRDIMKFMLYHEWKFKQRWSTSPPISTKQKQSRETGNIVYTRRRGNQTWTIQRNWQHRVYKTKKNKAKTHIQYLCTVEAYM
jgi:hypothetical protein